MTCENRLLRRFSLKKQIFSASLPSLMRKFAKGKFSRKICDFAHPRVLQKFRALARNLKVRQKNPLQRGGFEKNRPEKNASTLPIKCAKRT